MNSLQPNRCLLLLVVLAAACTFGCSIPKTAADWKPSKLFSLDNAWPWGGDDELEPEIPNRIVGMWTDTVLHTAGQKPQRGFGGRLIFYGKDGNTPVAVDGELVVYAFEETGRDPTDNKPTRRYVFPADQIAQRHSKSPLGPSYSFWLPWDEAGGAQSEVSLICRFEPKGGAVVTSEQTRHRLPGSMTPGTVVAGQNGPQIPEGVPYRPAQPQLAALGTQLAATADAQQASFESPLPAAAEPQRQMTTISIPLPNNFQLPRGTAAPRPLSAVPGGQPSAPQMQPPIGAEPSTSDALPPGLETQTTTVPADTTWAATNFQPQNRQTQPAVYNPMRGSTAIADQTINQPLHVPRPIGITAPGINMISPISRVEHPQLMTVWQKMALQQMPQQPMNGQPAPMQQVAQQPFATAISGTPTVIYR